MPVNIMQRTLKYDAGDSLLTVEEDKYVLKRRLFVIGGGKASGQMAEALEGIIPAENITAGIINCKGGVYQVKKIKIMLAGHPIPDQKGMAGVQEMLSLKQRYSIKKGDIILCLVSGGRSALLPLPLDGITLEDIQQTTELLLYCGADIVEINTIRKHLSKSTGGRLGQFFSPATVI